MTRPLLYAILVQGGGAAIAILTVLGVSRYFGPNQQGSFALYKNWYEITSIALLLGLPQGIIYTVNKLHISPAFALRLALLHTLLAAVPVLVVSCLQSSFRYLPPTHIPFAPLAMTLGVCGYIFHGLARNIVLTVNDGLEFSLLAVAPTVGVVPLILVLGLYHGFDAGIVFAVNGVSCGLLAWAMLVRRDLGPVSANAGWRQILLSQSGHFLLQSLLFAVQPFAAYYLLKRSTGGVQNVGIFSFALVTLVAANSLIAMVAPILVNRWSKVEESHAERQLRGALVKIALRVGLPVAGAVWLAAPVSTMIIGKGFSDAVPLIRILSAAVVPLIFTRIAQPALMALGRADIGTMMGLTRVATMMAVALASTGALSPLPAVAWAWVAAEYAAAILLVTLLRSPGRGSMGDIAPINEV